MHSPPGTIIQGNQIIVLAEDKSSFEDRYGFPAFDKYDGKLDNEGEIIWLQKITANGPIMLDAVTYSSTFPWDSQANAGIHDLSLALIDGNVNNDTHLNWKVQCNDQFTPGEENDFSCFQGLQYPGLTINEIHYNPIGGSDFEFIEIANHSNTLIDLEAVSLTTGAFYVFESHFLLGKSAAPNNKIVLAKDSASYHNQYGTAPHGEFLGTLSNLGESLRLRDLFGELIDEVRYDDVSPWPTEANQGNHSLALIDGSLDNSLPESWCVQGQGYTPNGINVFEDSDNDNIIDCLDTCPGVDDALTGSACNDGDPCTTGEQYDSSCNCTGGIFQDSDNDGVCDENDSCPGFDDTIDLNNDGVPDACEGCEDIVIENTFASIVSDTSANISIESNGNVSAANTINFSAGQEISLMPGFEVELGAVFHAFISTCN